MKVTSVSIKGDVSELTIIKSGTDLVWGEDPRKGIPEDADDSQMWGFCMDILKHIDGPPHLGVPYVGASEIYAAIKPMLERE